MPRKLNELGFVGRGRSRNRPRNDPTLYGGPYPFIQTADIMASELRITKYSQTYSEKGLAQSRLWDENTLCMTIAGENTAETAILSFRACFPDSIVGFIADPDKVDVRFIKYYLDTIKHQLKNISKGATQDNLSLDKLLSFDILTPLLDTQHKIAAILSAYDDLIENNTRRIAILEKMAQSLYREWFVHFRFPGHEKKRLVESTLGLIPEGWKVKTFGEVALNFDSKRKPLSSLQRVKMKGEYPYYGAAKVFDHINSYIFDGKYLLIAEDGSVITDDKKPVLQIATGKFWVNNHTHVVQGKGPVPTDFLYLFLSNFDISGYITGAAQPKVTQANLNRILIAIPSEYLLNQFDSFVESMLNYVFKLENRNANLRKTRDLLLPKLISGEVDVERLEVDGKAVKV
jgi:type I restriction enzyme, S subunit